MKAYLVEAWTVPQAILPTREQAERWVANGMHFLSRPPEADEYRIVEIECISYDASPEFAFVKAWDAERANPRPSVMPIAETLPASTETA